MPLTNSDDSFVPMIIIVVTMLPVFAIESPIFRVPIMLSKDSVPDQREIVVDVDGEGREVLLYVVKIEAPKHIPSNSLGS